MPPIAADVDAARDAAFMLMIRDALTRDSSLGLGATGPSDAFYTMQGSLNIRMGAVVQQLKSIGFNIMKTAQDMANVDHDTMIAFKNAGGEL